MGVANNLSWQQVPQNKLASNFITTRHSHLIPNTANSFKENILKVLLRVPHETISFSCAYHAFSHLDGRAVLRDQNLMVTLRFQIFWGRWGALKRDRQRGSQWEGQRWHLLIDAKTKPGAYHQLPITPTSLVRRVSNLCIHQNHLGCSLNQAAGPMPRVSDSKGLEWGPSLTSSQVMLKIACLGTTLRTTLQGKGHPLYASMLLLAAFL